VYGDGVDGFLSVIDQAGTEIIYSTYYGGGDWDSILQVNMDERGRLVTTGFVHSGGFETVNAFQSEYMGSSDAIITIWSKGVELNSFLGGYSQEHPFAQVLQDGKLYVVGESASPEFEVSEEALQTSLAGGEDGFIWVMDYQNYLESDFTPEPSGPNIRPYISLGVVLGSIAVWFLVMRRMFRES
jgi:hypothetical protein